MTTWYHKEQTSVRRIAMSERFYCHSREKRSIFYTSYRKKRRQRAYFLRCHIPKCDDVIACESMSIIAKTRQHNIFWCCGKQSYCRGATTLIQPSQDVRTQQSNFSCCPSKDDSNKRCWSWDNGNKRTLVRRIARSDVDKGWLRQRDARSRHATTNKKIIASQVGERLSAIRSREGQWWAPLLCRIAMSKRRQIHFFRSIAREQVN